MKTILLAGGIILMGVAFPAPANASGILVPEALGKIRLAVFSDLYSRPTERKDPGKVVLLKIDSPEWTSNADSYVAIFSGVKRLNKFRESIAEGLLYTDGPPQAAVLVEISITGIVLADSEVLAGIQSNIISETDTRNEYYWFHVRSDKDGQMSVVERRSISVGEYLDTLRVSKRFSIQGQSTGIPMGGIPMGSGRGRRQAASAQFFCIME